MHLLRADDPDKRIHLDELVNDGTVEVVGAVLFQDGILEGGFLLIR
jgi:hypothetical protein